MELETKPPNLIIPSYSIKEDILPYQNCRLRYRYHNGGSLPYARPEQFWFGLFVHGALELAYRYWKSETDSGRTVDWQDRDIGKFANDAETSLRNQGISAPSSRARNSAYGKVATMVNALGAHLFPLIDKVEYRISATRQIPRIGADSGRDRYELRGVLDALARPVRNMDGNLIREYVKKACPNIERGSELILEYKAAERPKRASLWKQDALQVHAYAWLREQESGKLPAAGVVIYVNELPELANAIRVIPISRRSVKSAIAEIDAAARQIEIALADEETDGNAIRSWQPDCQDKTVCAACDFRYFCPKPAGRSGGYIPKAPSAP